MQVYHFSVRFEGSDMSYHGEFISSIPTVDDIVFRAKQKLTEKLTLWGKDGKDVVFFEVYKYDKITDNDTDNDTDTEIYNEVVVFRYEKK